MMYITQRGERRVRREKQGEWREKEIDRNKVRDSEMEGVREGKKDIHRKVKWRKEMERENH